MAVFMFSVKCSSYDHTTQEVNFLQSMQYSQQNLNCDEIQTIQPIGY